MLSANSGTARSFLVERKALSLLRLLYELHAPSFASRLGEDPTNIRPAERIPVRTSEGRSLLCKSYPTLRQARPRAGPEAAMRVRKISAQCVLQFTPSLAAGCVLHRPVSRVIHHSELSFCSATSRKPYCVRIFDSRSAFP